MATISAAIVAPRESSLIIPTTLSSSSAAPEEMICEETVSAVAASTVTFQTEPLTPIIEADAVASDEAAADAVMSSDDARPSPASSSSPFLANGETVATISNCNNTADLNDINNNVISDESTQGALDALAALASGAVTLSSNYATSVTPQQTSDSDESEAMPPPPPRSPTLSDAATQDATTLVMVGTVPSSSVITASTGQSTHASSSRLGRLRSASNPEGMEKWDSYSRRNDRQHFVLPSSILEEELASTRKVLGEQVVGEGGVDFGVGGAAVDGVGGVVGDGVDGATSSHVWHGFTPSMTSYSSETYFSDNNRQDCIMTEASSNTMLSSSQIMHPAHAAHTSHPMQHPPTQHLPNQTHRNHFAASSLPKKKRAILLGTSPDSVTDSFPNLSESPTPKTSSTVNGLTTVHHHGKAKARNDYGHSGRYHNTCNSSSRNINNAQAKNNTYESNPSHTYNSHATPINKASNDIASAIVSTSPPNSASPTHIEEDESTLEPEELLRRARSRLLEDLSEGASLSGEKGVLTLPHSLSKYKEVGYDHSIL